ncbi:hypothetical protein [Acinetobacter baumannii]|uniref:hypothetical protein n=1 Tax=Acinetobacter baumannii TaxID=470 RepID=UPI00385A6040
MSIIIRSNTKASRYIASRLALSLPPDYKHKLDFVAEDYVINGVKTTLAQCISTTRSSTAGYLDSSGNYATVLANQPRIHNDPNSGKGLLCEEGYINLITNYSSPTNQTFAINVSTTQFVVFQMFGEGSCEVQVNNIVIGTMTKNNPIIYTPSAAGAISVTLTNSGEVNHVQAFFSYVPKPCMTKLTTTATARDIHYFRPNFADNSIATVVFKRTELKRFSDSLIGGRAFINFQFLPKTSGYLSLASGKGVENPTKSIYSVIATGGAAAEQKFGTSLSDEVVAIAFDFKTKLLKVFENGGVRSLNLPDFQDQAGFDRYILGTFAAGAQIIAGQLIKEVYVYNRVLSDIELMQITS